MIGLGHISNSPHYAAKVTWLSFLVFRVGANLRAARSSEGGALLRARPMNIGGCASRVQGRQTPLYLFVHQTVLLR